MMTKEEIREKLGGYNDLPPNLQYITESEFLWRFGQKNANAPQEFRQVVMPSVSFGDTSKVLRDDKQQFCKVYMWINSDFAGVGFIIHYNGKATRSETDAFFAQHFKFNYCDHEFKTTATANCYWEGKCEKCGFVSVVDSSG